MTVAAQNGRSHAVGYRATRAPNQVGGLAAATTWPLRSNQALDVFFDKSTDPAVGVYPAGFYRGLVDTASKPSARGTQKLMLDFDDLRCR